MVLKDEIVCKILGNKNVKSYKYGTLKPKIDEIMLLLSKEIDVIHKKDIERIKSELISYIKAKE